MVLEPVFDRIEDHAFGRPLLLERVVHHLGLVLRADAGQEFLLSLGDAQPLERVLDGVRNVVPGALHLLLRLHIEVDLMQRRLEMREVPAPGRHRLRLVDLQGLQTELEHPLRLLLVLRNLPDDSLVQPGLCPIDVRLFIDESVLIFVETEPLYELIFWHDPSSPAESRRATR